MVKKFIHLIDNLCKKKIKRKICQVENYTNQTPLITIPCKTFSRQFNSPSFIFFPPVFHPCNQTDPKWWSQRKNKENLSANWTEFILQIHYIQLFSTQHKTEDSLLTMEEADETNSLNFKNASLICILSLRFLETWLNEYMWSFYNNLNF